MLFLNLLLLFLPLLTLIFVEVVEVIVEDEDLLTEGTEGSPSVSPTFRVKRASLISLDSQVSYGGDVSSDDDTRLEVRHN